MRKKVVVLGCGLVGATIVRDLADDEGLEVVAVDRDRERLDPLATRAPRAARLQVDLGDPARLVGCTRGAAVAVGALPSALGFRALQALLDTGTPVCDISFMAEDALSLDELARKRGVCAVVDCGVAPGLANLAVGRSHARFELTERVVYYVGGLPKLRRWPYEYTAPFAPADVLEEYTRPVRLKCGGQQVVREALSEPELLDFERVGTLEGFLTDGLRSLLVTVPAPEMQEKTLRYPGHAGLMRVLRETGLFGTEPVEVQGQRVVPRALTSKLLFARWARQPTEEDFTLLRVIVEGRESGRRRRHIYDLYDEYDPVRSESSMARTTGFPCAIVARWLSRGELAIAGVLPPERLGADIAMYDRLVTELAARGVRLRLREEELSAGC